MHIVCTHDTLHRLMDTHTRWLFHHRTFLLASFPACSSSHHNNHSSPPSHDTHVMWRHDGTKHESVRCHEWCCGTLVQVLPSCPSRLVPGAVDFGSCSNVVWAWVCSRVMLRSTQLIISRFLSSAAVLVCVCWMSCSLLCLVMSFPAGFTRPEVPLYRTEAPLFRSITVAHNNNNNSDIAPTGDATWDEMGYGESTAAPSGAKELQATTYVGTAPAQPRHVPTTLKPLSAFYRECRDIHTHVYSEHIPCLCHVVCISMLCHAHNFIHPHTHVRTLLPHLCSQHPRHMAQPVGTSRSTTCTVYERYE